MKKIFFSLLIFSAFFLSKPVHINADSFVEPTPFEIYSEDGTYVLKWDPGGNDNWDSGTAKASVYKNGEFLYSIDSLPIMGVGKNNFFPSQDFECLFFKPTTGFSTALEFYSRDELIKKYYINELVDNMDLVIHSVTMSFWTGKFEGKNSGFDYIPERNILRLITVESMVYEFDLLTGNILSKTESPAISCEIISDKPPKSIAQFILPVSVFTVLGAAVLFTLKKNLRNDRELS
ncbi:MAG: hypothetical protein FWE82_01555 [Defluviitaleaceae bacterium]|nr:hypothetical protein [Defluviitaleaceae bacterium]